MLLAKDLYSRYNYYWVFYDDPHHDKMCIVLTITNSQYEVNDNSAYAAMLSSNQGDVVSAFSVL
jgi:hypothetical protein